MTAPNQHDEMLQAILARLNDLFEKDIAETLDVDALRQDTPFSRGEMRAALAPLYANGWIEEAFVSAAEYFGVRLTVGGKEQYDKQTGNAANEQIREYLLERLAAQYGKDVDAMTDSEALAKEFGLERNVVCLNLLILEKHGLVELEELHGVGHALYSVWLTPQGKYAHDNPEPDLVFLSHAAADEEIARHLKQVFEACFPRLDVFVSSDPEDLPPGSAWVGTVLKNLKLAKVLLILATERGLNRKWVWFETGAGWSRGLLFIPCCVGKTRKSQLPHPFSGYQALNIDEEADFVALLNELKNRFGAPQKAPETQAVIAELARLDIRAEERAKATSAQARTRMDEARDQILYMIAEFEEIGTKSFLSDDTIADKIGMKAPEVRKHLDILSERDQVMLAKNQEGDYGVRLKPAGWLQVESFRARKIS